jgi:hypothetical protein
MQQNIDARILFVALLLLFASHAMTTHGSRSRQNGEEARSMFSAGSRAVGLALSK